MAGLSVAFSLFDAVKNGKVAVVTQLLDSGDDLQAIKGLYGPLLAHAAECGHDEIVRLLLDRGAEVNGDKGKVGPLVSALSRGRYGIARLLIERGADVEVTWSGGNTPLSAAIFAKDQGLLEAILKRRKPAPIKSDIMLWAAAFATLPMIVMLIEAGAKIDGAGPYGGETPLVRAAEHGRSDIVKYLLDRGADPPTSDSARNTALLRAAAAGHVEVMRVLLDAGAELGARNAQDLNALMLACKAGKVEAAKLLLERGLSPNEIEEKDGTTALTMAKAQNAEPLVRLLIAHGARERELHRPPSGAFVSIMDCAICAYLWPYKELERREEPDDLPLLERVHQAFIQPDRYSTQTHIVRRCPSCNTYYHHYHYIDTEDSVATPPTMEQHLQRYNLRGLMETLAILGKQDELAQVQALHSALIEQFRSVLKENHIALKPNILPHVVESVVDDLIARERFAELESWLLWHADQRVGLETLENLVGICVQTSTRHTYPRARQARDYIDSMQDKLKPWLLANHALLEEHIRSFECSQDAAWQRRARDARLQAEYGQILQPRSSPSEANEIPPGGGNFNQSKAKGQRTRS